MIGFWLHQKILCFQRSDFVLSYGRFSTFKGPTFGFQTVDFLPSQVDFCAFKKNLFTFKLQLSPFIPVTISFHWSGYLPLFLPECPFIPSAFYPYSFDFLPLFGKGDRTTFCGCLLIELTEGKNGPFEGRCAAFRRVSRGF